MRGRQCSCRPWRSRWATGASINITVNPVNDPPSFTKGTDQTVNEDAGAQSVASWATGMSPGPSDESAQTLTFQVSNDNTALFSSQPVFDATTGDLTYTPANNANGSTQVTVSLQDNGGTDNGGVDTSDLQYFNITVNPVNDPPVVTDFSKNGNEDSDIAFSASDFVNSFSDIDGDTLVKIQVTSLSISGTLKLNGAPVTLNQEIVYADLGGLTFTPKLNWHGTTSIGWNASDGNAYATIGASINITVTSKNDPPVADDDTYSTLEDKELIVDAKHGVLKSDVDPDGDNLTARLINNSVSNGTVNLDPDGSFRYIPEPNFNGPANFKYVANDGQADSNVATVTIKVGIENDPPNAQDDTATTPEDTPVAINVIANDFDVDGDMDVNTLSVFNPPIFGSTEVVQSSGIIMYTPDLNIHGVDHFEYEICDTVEECATATVTVTVTSVNDPPVAIKDTYYINITTKPPLIVQPPGVLSNDSDNDVEDELNAILVTNVNNEKQFTFNPDGSFEYSPRSGFNGIDGFTYKAFDGVLYSAVTQVGIVVDTESPTVEWISPVDNGSVLSVNGEVITLSVNATDKLGIERVNFYRWDAESTIFVIIGDVYSEPFTHDLNTNELNTGWNQIFAVSFDIAGNVSERQHIWLMREIPVNNTIYLPIVHSK